MIPRFPTDALRRLSSRLHADARRFCPPQPSATPFVMPSIELLLPTPESLTPRLVALGLTVPSAEKISEVTTAAILRLKDNFQNDYVKRCQSLQPRARYFQDPRASALLPKAYVQIFASAVQRLTSHILNVYVPRVIRARTSEPHISNVAPRKRSFNQTAVPLLEGFFEENAFPSRLEKLELASKCDMEYKQIHIWFQNRRSRCKREGKELKKPASNDALLHELETSVLDALIPPAPEEESLTEGFAVPFFCDSVPPLQVPASRFNLDAPPHAFPAPYPTPCPYDPFPMAPDKRKFDLTWVRRPQSHVLSVAPSLEIADIVVAFSKLTIGEECSDEERCQPPRRSRRPPIRPVSRTCQGFLTVCSPAPHPALINRLRSCPHTSLPSSLASLNRQAANPSEETIALSQTRQLQRAHTNQEALSSTNIAPHSSSTSSPVTVSHQLKRTLPRRRPKHPPLQRDVTLPVSSALSIPCSATGSRRPRSASRSTTSGSDADSPLHTPTQDSILLPALLGISVLTPGDACSITSLALPQSLSKGLWGWLDLGLDDTLRTSVPLSPLSP